MGTASCGIWFANYRVPDCRGTGSSLRIPTELPRFEFRSRESSEIVLR